MKVFIDGKEVKWANDVKIIYEDIQEGADTFTNPPELHITLRDDGVTYDLIDNDNDQVAETQCATPDEIAQHLMD